MCCLAISHNEYGVPGAIRLESYMSITELELQQFNDFARGMLQASDVQPSLAELMDLWQLEHMTAAQRDENLAAMQAALLDFQNGDRGQPAGLLSRQLRQELRGNDLSGT